MHLDARLDACHLNTTPLWVVADSGSAYDNLHADELEVSCCSYKGSRFDVSACLPWELTLDSATWIDFADREKELTLETHGWNTVLHPISPDDHHGDPQHVWQEQRRWQQQLPPPCPCGGFDAW